MPNFVVIVDLKNKFKQAYSIGDVYVAVEDFAVTENYVALATRALSKLFIVPFNSNSAFTVDIDYFTSRKIPGIQIFKPKGLRTIRNSNFLYVININ